MQGFRHIHPSPGEGDAFQFANPSSDARSKQELVRELDEAKRSNRDSEMREKGISEEPEKTKAILKSLETATQIISEENQVLREELGKTVRENTELTEV
jgi:ribonuclease D